MAGPPSTNYATGRPCATHSVDPRRSPSAWQPNSLNETSWAAANGAFYDLDDAPTDTEAGEPGPIFGGPWFYDHISASNQGSYTLNGGNSIGRSGGAPLGGTTSLSLTRVNTAANKAHVMLPLSSSGGVAQAAIVWTRFVATTFAPPYQIVQSGSAIDLHGNNPVAWITALRISNSGANSAGSHVYTADGGQTLHYVDDSYNLLTASGPGPGRWFMTSLIWQPIIDSTHGTMEWYRGYQGIGGLSRIGTLTNVGPFNNTQASFGLTAGIGIPGWANYESGFTAEWCALGAWKGSSADAIRETLNGNSDGSGNFADAFCPPGR